MGGYPVQDHLLAACFANQADIGLCQIANSAMQETTGATAGPRREILLIYQAGPKSTHRRIAGETSTDDSTADDKDIIRAVGPGLGV